MTKKIPLSVRFWRHVDKSGPALKPGIGPCWIWTGGKTRGNYGTVNRGDGVMMRTNRAAWSLAHGSIPPGKHVLHSCDNPPCVRATHLFLGTNDDNIADREAKGRTLRGELVPAAKLTTSEVQSIRRRIALGERCSDIARDLGISSGTVYDIAHKRTWKHLEERIS